MGMNRKWHRAGLRGRGNSLPSPFSHRALGNLHSRPGRALCKVAAPAGSVTMAQTAGSTAGLGFLSLLFSLRLCPAACGEFGDEPGGVGAPRLKRGRWSVRLGLRNFSLGGAGAPTSGESSLGGKPGDVHQA